MGANSRQGWALLLFIVGFTFFVAGRFALGPIFSIVGLVLLIASAISCYRMKPPQHRQPENTLETAVKPAKAKGAV